MMDDLRRNLDSQRRPTRSPYHTGAVQVTKRQDGTVTTRVWPSPGVIAIAERLRSWYTSEYETDAPISDWFPNAIELISAYLEAEGEA